jgi:hypothetical protein
MDDGISVALLTGFKKSVTEETMRRSGVKFRRINRSDVDSLDISEILVLDELLLSADSNVGVPTHSLESFADRGGRVIILRQIAEDWNRMRIIPGIQLTDAHEYVPTDSVVYDPSHPLFAGPHRFEQSDWDGWIYARTLQSISVITPDVDVPLRIASDGNPLLIETRKGKGRLLYVNLALSWQWLNIHEGSFRFLANLLSY